MRSPDGLTQAPRARISRALFAKDVRELLASRAYWILLVVIGPLVGESFIAAVNLYAEASGAGGGPAALAQGLSPLDGIFVPTFGAYDLAATFLFPFVAIRLVSSERTSGALKLLLQAPAGMGRMLALKLAVLMLGWAIAWTPGIAALVLWKAYGGTAYSPEVANLLVGHLLRAIVTAGVALVAAAVSESAASAAILTLAFTLGTWMLDYVAAARGGVFQELAAYTPNAALRTFEQGLVRANILIVSAVIGAAAIGVAAAALPTGRPLPWRVARAVAIVVFAAAAAAGAGRARASWDVSENRRNSFPRADEAALRQIRSPLAVTIYLAPEDPRLTDYERNILAKLRRTLPRVEATYGARSRTGLFEGSAEHYGEIWYDLDGHRAMSRSTTEPIVLAEIYRLAGVAPPAESTNEPVYPGHPLAARPAGASWFFYGASPVAAGLAWFISAKRSDACSSGIRT